ncbi:hypothetical protein PFISCL1PPCAC_24720 [Pristionchus fissidentatus]|uniref:Uncharacterized protein n=1 Tax=Pristionchus fissidentatus TaxID=1538716 RepID=A0AAV5WPV0_9BILA|nr:hypothetical protein PFISCL1PPCAC_24720 [Pristionchus fissidentatus]
MDEVEEVYMMTDLRRRVRVLEAENTEQRKEISTLERTIHQTIFDKNLKINELEEALTTREVVKDKPKDIIKMALRVFFCVLVVFVIYHEVTIEIEKTYALRNENIRLMESADKLETELALSNSKIKILASKLASTSANNRTMAIFVFFLMGIFVFAALVDKFLPQKKSKNEMEETKNELQKDRNETQPMENEGVVEIDEMESEDSELSDENESSESTDSSESSAESDASSDWYWPLHDDTESCKN